MQIDFKRDPAEPRAAEAGDAQPHIAETTVKIWLGYGAWSSCTGWALSAIGQLNSTGYLLAMVATLAIGLPLVWKHKPRFARIPVRRFHQALPLVYLVLFCGSLIGGLLYAPNNYDMLTYRVPRMLNWLVQGRWNWIHTYIDRMNYSGVAWEWMVLPLLAVSHRTSLFFLINIISYLLLPGLFFSFLRNIGVTGRMAWTWMWLLPAGLNFVMQAGGGSNDTLAVAFLLAGLNFAFRARRTARFGDIFWSLLAVALLTGCKASNLPLVLPCAIALLPAFLKVKLPIGGTLLTVVVVILSSLLPTLVLNYTYTRDWSGSPDDPDQLKIHNPAAGLLGNTLQLVVGNLQPPVMPLAGKWNEISARLVPGSIDRFLQREFPRFSLHINELPQEEQSGVGIGLTALAFFSLIISLRTRFVCSVFAKAPDPWRWAILASGLMAMIILMCVLGSEATARLATPYYVFGIAVVLIHPVNQQLARRRWWKLLTLLVSLSAIPALILTPSRPLFPAVRVTSALARRHPHSAAIQRAALVYKVYADRAENLAPLRIFFPPGQNAIGILGDDDTSETALWEPFGSHRVYDLTPMDTVKSVQAAGVRYAAVSADGLDDQETTLPAFLTKYNAKIIVQTAITLKVSEGPMPWFVVELGAGNAR